MLGGTRMFTFRGNSLKDRGTEVIEKNLEEFYHQMRIKGYVPIFGTEDINMGQAREYSVDWVMSIIGKECDNPWDVRGVTQEGDIEWFTTQEDKSSLYSTV